QNLNERQVGSAFTRELEQHYRRDMMAAEADGLQELIGTYTTFNDLVRHGRDSVWSYVARNLSRPLALSFGAGWANVLLGNRPGSPFATCRLTCKGASAKWPGANAST